MDRLHGKRHLGLGSRARMSVVHYQPHCTIWMIPLHSWYFCINIFWRYKLFSLVARESPILCAFHRDLQTSRSKTVVIALETALASPQWLQNSSFLTNDTTELVKTPTEKPTSRSPGRPSAWPFCVPETNSGLVVSALGGCEASPGTWSSLGPCGRTSARARPPTVLRSCLLLPTSLLTQNHHEAREVEWSRAKCRQERPCVQIHAQPN